MKAETQLSLWDDAIIPATNLEDVPTGPDDLSSYDRCVLFFSGGKDSVACLLHLLDLGMPRNKIELHHHLVDGNEGSTLMDWPCTDSYCEAFAKHFGVKYIRSWKVGGFEGEMLRENSLTAPAAWESESGSIEYSGGIRGKQSTRLKFPQVSPDLSVRYCSSYVKISIGSALLTNEPRFRSGKTLVITGERAEESNNRARYKTFEAHKNDLRGGAKYQRHIDHWRPVHQWSEEQVWSILKRYNVNPHPAYHLGWGRTSCLACIFGSKNQWATIQKYFPDKFIPVADYEKAFGVTIQRKHTVIELASVGIPYECDPRWVRIAMSKEWMEPIVVSPSEWVLPPGAFGESNGPV